ncbi:hypothetical protein [Ornithinimicrobium sediminis]|uniref:hypothetical protein n=1 Tax=Ornithinimicrobium sediminis TaxID=2904603 RepID=UPI001E410345|nr:hypothetical protein [Ornithinimicrobium sediminis]MCE0485479.1 hypothetical protein [Ornithinimicrobium sediminis]
MTTSQTAEAWGRGRLLAILAGAIGAGLVLLAGLGLFIWEALADDPTDTLARADSSNTVAEQEPVELVLDESTLAEAGPARREQIADADMPGVEDRRAFREGPVATTIVEPLEVPPAASTGPVGVPTGYPRTPQGAVAQLAAIDVAVIQGMSVPATHEIYRSWSTGEGEPAAWVMTRNVTDFLTAANQSGQHKESGLVVTATPAAGQVKGTDGDDWVVACVLLELNARLVEEARVAYGHCEAMTWAGERWLIDTTHGVAPAPSTWPGTDLAARAGWRPWASDH